MDYKSLFFGPHCIGLLFVIIGLLQKYMPPKNINRWYGYRTLRARASQEAWDAGNRYSADYMIKAGIALLIGGFILNAVSLLWITDYRVQGAISYFILFGGAMGVGILSTTATERYLKRTIKDKVVKEKLTKKRK